EVTFHGNEEEPKILLVKKSHFVNQENEFIISVITDITEIKDREKEILLYNKISDQISDSISVADIDGNIVYVNSSNARATGKSKHDIIGHSIMELDPQFKTKEDWNWHFKEVKENGELLVEGINKRKDGSEFRV